MTWIVGGRYGNAFTEVVRDDDLQPRVMVRTHAAARHPEKADYAERFGYEPTDEGAAMLAHVIDALNAADARHPHAQHPNTEEPSEP